jgi:hypothetical protein
VVQVIELRRKDRPQLEREESSATTAPDWRYQWVASGHWQQLRHVPDSVLAPSADYGLAA